MSDKITVELTQTEAIALAAILRGHDVNMDLTNVCERIENAYSAPVGSALRSVVTPAAPHIVLEVDGKIVDPTTRPPTTDTRGGWNALTIACPRCDAAIGASCTYRDGSTYDPAFSHASRVLASMDVGTYRQFDKLLTGPEVEAVRDLLRHTGWHSFTCHECGKQTDDCVTVRRHKHGECDESYVGPPVEELLAKVAAIFGLNHEQGDASR